MGVLAVVKYLLVLVDRINDPDHYRFNDYSSSTGVLLIVFRLSMFLYFLYSLRGLTSRSPLFPRFQA